MKLILSLTFIFFAVSCSSVRGDRPAQEKIVELDGYSSMRAVDFVDHLAAFEKAYLTSPGVELFRLSERESRYLRAIADDIMENNELFFSSSTTPTFTLVKSNVPFHFSLPGMRIFFSTGLIAKYIKNEKLLYAVMAYELIRSEKNIYRKVQIVPTGYMSTSRILSLLRLNTPEKVETHKWAYYTLKRVGVDPDIYLSWLQILNRNSGDFALQLGDTSSISREESLFKAFIIENSKSKTTSLSKYEASSRDFYSFINRIKR